MHLRRFILLAIFGLLALAPAARAATKTYTYREGPIPIGGYEVRQEAVGGIPHPDVEGFITHMSVDIVDKAGHKLPIRRIMLHHVVFSNMGRFLGERHDATCSAFTMWDSVTSVDAFAERFYAAGEERAKMQLPPGYGYPIHPGDKWLMLYMLMNHKQLPDRAYIRYRVTVDTGDALTAVTPYWLDVRNCQADPIFNVPGGGKPGSTYTQTATWTAPVSGRIVAGGGHVHGGAKGLTLTEPACANRTIATSKPLWGLPSHPFYHVFPILHEPGPINMSRFTSERGIPVAKGETLTLTARYDNALPHTRVMGIMLIYVAPDQRVTGPCAAIPGDVKVVASHRPGRRVAPRFIVPLTGIDGNGRAVRISRPAGRTVAVASGSTIKVGDNYFKLPNVKVAPGAQVTWRFDTALLHNVTLADGPRGFASVNLNAGRSFSQTFAVPGTYRLFCALHPVQMTETVTVAGAKGPGR
jgi:plastocyanin